MNARAETHVLEGLSAQCAGDHSVRQAWIDRLRTAVIVLVVNMHCCVTYSYVGDWYLKDGPEGSLREKLPYIFWIFHLQSFFMGLLFFIAGSMADAAIRRHGASRFMRERLLRLGAPALLYMTVLHPLIVFGLLRSGARIDDVQWMSAYKLYFTTGQVLSGSGPMWFVIALLLFSAALAVWRGLSNKWRVTERRAAPRASAIVAFAAVLAIATAVTRCYLPIGTSVLNLQLCYFPQYIGAFAVGVLAGAEGWLSELAASRQAKVAGQIAITAGPLALGLLLFLGGGPTEGPRPGEHGPILYFGGWNAQAYWAAAWEQFTGVGLALGMLAWFKRRTAQERPLWQWLTQRSFAVYLFHAPILIWLTLQFRSIHVDQLSHVLLLTVIGLMASFVVADGARRIPWLRRAL